MKTDDLWNKFLESGRITDYLRYRESIQEELALEPLATEEANESEHGRDRDPGEGDGRE
ncbi:MAG: hypothetical protein ACI4I5_03175 [Acutalibacteraceae bacterium]